MRKHLSAALPAATFGLLASVASLSEAQPVGEIIPNVTFDCRGTINYLVKPNSNRPAFVGHVQTIVDLPAEAGRGSWQISGVLELGSSLGGGAPRERVAQINRCFGRGDLSIGQCRSFSGVNICDMRLDAANFRVRIDRGGNGLFTMDGGMDELFSTSGAGTELFTMDAGTEE